MFKLTRSTFCVSLHYNYLCSIANLEELRRKIVGNHRNKQINEIFDVEEKLNSFFNISDQFFELVTQMDLCKIMTSTLFNSEVNLIGRRILQSQKSQLDHSEIQALILIPTTESLQRKFINILSGQIKTEEVFLIFSKIDKDRHLDELTTIQKFLQSERFNQAKIKECVNKIQCVFHLEECVGMVDGILDVSDALELKGDFSNVQMIKRKVKYIFLEN